MPKITVEIPQHIVDDVNNHVGDDKKFVNFSDAVRTSLRKMLDIMDRIDEYQGRKPKEKDWIWFQSQTWKENLYPGKNLKI